MFLTVRRACAQESALNVRFRELQFLEDIGICQFELDDMVMVVREPGVRAKSVQRGFPSRHRTNLNLLESTSCSVQMATFAQVQRRDRKFHAERGQSSELTTWEVRGQTNATKGQPSDTFTYAHSRRFGCITRSSRCKGAENQSNLSADIYCDCPSRTATLVSQPRTSGYLAF